MSKCLDLYKSAVLTDRSPFYFSPSLKRPGLCHQIGYLILSRLFKRFMHNLRSVTEHSVKEINSEIFGS
jgi:hypothetical protein